MNKIRINFLIRQDLIQMVNDIAKIEDTSASDIYRRAIKEYIQEYPNRPKKNNESIDLEAEDQIGLNP